MVRRRLALPASLLALAVVLFLSVWPGTPAALSAADPVRSGAPDAAPTPAIELRVTGADAGPPIRAGFVGVTTEYNELFKEVGTDPNQPDVPFETVLENLAPDGGLDLRIGGDTTDWTWWPIPGMTQPAWARWTLTPTWMAVAQKLLEDLHAHLIIGINLEADSPAVATAEVAAINSGIGPSVPTTFELGNEPELYPIWPFYITKSRQTVFGRSLSYSFPQITSDWDRLAAQLGTVRLAGPSYSSYRALPYVEQFLHDSLNLNLDLLTLHTYALTPQNCQHGGALQESSLFDTASLQGLAAAVSGWAAVGRQNDIAVRVDEINAVTCGGLANFSDTMGPSLWALNILPLYAQTSVTGVNFETRPNTAQNLIQTTATSSGWQVSVQPEYYGMLAFARLTPPGSRILSVSTTPSTPTTPVSTSTTPPSTVPTTATPPPTTATTPVTTATTPPSTTPTTATTTLTTPTMPTGVLAWADETPKDALNVVVTNVTNRVKRFAIQVAGASGPATAETLVSRGASLASAAGVTLGGQTISAQTGQLTGPPVTTEVKPASDGTYAISVAPASATILSVHDNPARKTTSSS